MASTFSSSESSSAFSTPSTKSHTDLPLISDFPAEFDSCNSLDESSTSSSPQVPWDLQNSPDMTLPWEYSPRYGELVPIYSDPVRQPYLGHTQWKQSRNRNKTPISDRRGGGNDEIYTQDVTRWSNSRSRRRNTYSEKPISRDFFLIIALCIGLACTMICLARPALIAWFGDNDNLL